MAFRISWCCCWISSTGRRRNVSSSLVSDCGDQHKHWPRWESVQRRHQDTQKKLFEACQRTCETQFGLRLGCILPMYNVTPRSRVFFKSDRSSSISFCFDVDSARLFPWFSVLYHCLRCLLSFFYFHMTVVVVVCHFWPTLHCGGSMVR